VRDSQVALVTGGGSGHEPAHAGYIGAGMLTAAVCGGVFASPTVAAVLDTIRTVCGAPGCLLIVKNYTGDRLNFGMAAEQAKAEGFKVEMVICGDDVAVNAGEECENVVTGRRGLSGTVFVHKVAGAAAGAGASLADVAQEAAAAAAAVGSMGVALSSCVVPGGRRDAERLAGDSVEVGLGIHGEPGRAKQALCPADELVGQLVGRILAVLAPPPRVALMVNNMGGTSVLETHIVARAAAAALRAAGHDVARVYTGAFMTSLEMAGVLLSVLALDEPRLARLDAPAAALAWPAVSFAGRGADASRVAPIVAAAPTAAGGDDAGAGATSEAQTVRAAACVRAACGAAIAAEGALTRLDQTVGDGDCGATFRCGAQAVLDALPSYAASSPGQLCASMGATVRDVMGGSSGAIIGIMLHAASSALRTNPANWAAALSAAVESAQFYGGARGGCRTMLDALIPAAAAAQAGSTLAQIAEAAEQGAEATKSMRALAGRSSYISDDQVLGTPDPGAVAMATMLRAMADAVAE